MTLPHAVLCDLWPINDMSCCPDWATLDDAEKLDLQARATEILDLLTGQQFGVCETTIRPCADHQLCPLPADQWNIGPSWDGPYPYILDGKWHNCGCTGIGGCDCRPPCSARLDPGPVLEILEITIDGVVLPATNPAGVPNYVIYDWRYLVRTDGQCWPDCQDWNQTPQPPDGTGTPVICGVWTVKYRYGNPVSANGVSANSDLICELLKAKCGSSGCRLPAGAVQVVRDGITIEIDPKKWINNLPTVAAWINLVNPGGLIAPSKIILPKRRPRIQTWPVP